MMLNRELERDREADCLCSFAWVSESRKVRERDCVCYERATMLKDAFLFVLATSVTGWMVCSIFRQSSNTWSSLVEGDEGCIGPSGKMLCL